MNSENNQSVDGETIGKSVSRPDAIDKVRGRARFVDDLAFPSMLHGRVIRSSVPHARILDTDMSNVTSYDQVVCTVTAADVPGKNSVHVIYDDQPALANSIVRYVGEPIALVAAKDRYHATMAAKLARVQFEELPAVFDAECALRSDAPAVAVPDSIESPPNVFNEMRLRNGDVEKGFREAEVVIEGEYTTGYQEHAYLEPQGAIAVPEENGSMAIWCTMQCPFYVQVAVAGVLGLPLSKVRVVQTATGGAFGGKEEVPSLVASLAALLAHKAQVPVKLIYDRKEDIDTTSKRHPSIVRYRSGATSDGRLTAVDVELIYNSGAYQTLSSAVLWRGLMTAAGPYRVANAKIDAYSVATNTVPCGAFRGFGSPQVIFPHESQMDRLADRLGLDRLEIRRRNILHKRDKTVCNQQLEESVGAAKALDRAGELASWNKRVSDIAAINSRQSKKRQGLGVATVIYGVGLGGKAPFLDKAGAYMKLEADGSLSIAIGTTEMGQGMTTVATQIASEALQIPAHRIHIVPVDTSRVPDSGPTVASRGTTMSGMAIINAARKLQERIQNVAHDLGIAEDDIPQRLNEIARAFWMWNLDPAVEGWAQAQPVSWDSSTGLGNAYFVYSYATHIAEVEVDLVTGEVSVEKLVAVHDSGRIVNPQLASGQVEGGAVQGLGFALTEELSQQDGSLTSKGFTTYRIPTIRDVPQIQVSFVEDIFPKGPFGAKGLGEVPLMASHAAISRAVAHATSKPVTSYPLSPELVKRTLT